jgi:NADH:ubiquinone oxidoreductase subunit E
MVAVVDDAAAGIWRGGNKTYPLSTRQWVEIEMNTYQLQAAATLVSIGGTGPADRGWVTSPGFQERARKLNDIAVTARSAVMAKNQMALRGVGDRLVDVCTDCHDVFKPSIPTGGILLKRRSPH